jgi:beta-lactamase regulating signal transducer with metallopeptidase domain
MIFGGLDMSAMAWLSREEMGALGWTLLHFCWQGTAVALAYGAVDRMTSRATSKTRYVVALAALTLMPMVVIGTFAEEIRIATPSLVNRTTVQVISGPLIGARPRAILHEIPLSSSLEEPGDWFAMRAERLLPWVDGLWMVGVFLLAIRSLGGWWQLENVRRRARRMVPQEVERGFWRICKQVQVGRQVALRVSDEVISPLAMGVWRVTVILPMSAVMGLSREELEAVMAHELGHVRRWDYLWNLLQTAVESVLFFHPAVWWLSRTVRERREVCCDEIAVRSCAGAAIYARALLRLEEHRTVQLRLAMALQGCDGLLLARVRNVLGEGMATESRMRSGVTVASAGALLMALLLGPKVGEAVAAPMVAAAQPVVAHVIAALPKTVGSARDGANRQPAVPAPSAVLETNVRLQRSKSAPVIAPSSMPQVRPEHVDVPDVAVNVVMASTMEVNFQEARGTASSKGMAYLDGMRDAGYPLDLNNDLDLLVSMKSLGVTPEYAKSMGAAGLGKPTAHDLITLKSMGITPEYVAALKQSGIGPKDFHEVVTEKALGITPEYAVAMKQKGFGDLNVHELITLKAQGMTPEYAGWLKQQFPQATMDELRRAAVFHLNEKFMAEAKAHGFDGKSLDKLLRLKMSGLLDE